MCKTIFPIVLIEECMVRHVGVTYGEVIKYNKMWAVGVGGKLKIKKVH